MELIRKYGGIWMEKVWQNGWNKNFSCIWGYGKRVAKGRKLYGKNTAVVRQGVNITSN
jgi:hypothetical protein